jgi:DNA topoisomerase-1
MAKNLVIVESPAKAKTIEGYLGKDYKVVSSYGHVRDLPKDDMAIDVENNFKPTYEIPKEKKDVIKELKKLAQNSDLIYLASDDDREGEAISWHLKEALNLEDARTRRIVFREITKNAILNAIQSPRGLDLNLINAQQARRVLDRLVGFEISPVLWRKIQTGLSAGRVQSVAVRLVVEREREIERFESASFFRVQAFFRLDNNVELKAELPGRIQEEKDARALLEKCVDAAFSIENLEKKPGKRSPSPPFTTSTLQQEAGRKLGFSVSRTMSLAQKLYESGKISYMRTDSVSLSEEALGQAKEEITRAYGAEYAKTRQYKSKAKNTQEAHEAIRPTNFGERQAGANSNEERLYELIWKRAIASQMADASIEKTVATIGISTAEEKLTAQGEVVTFEGFLKVYSPSSDDDEQEANTGSMLPPLKVGQTLDLKKMQARQGFTKPAPRYTEATLVRKLEEMGIGRPSTYAPTITTIQKRNYVVKESRPGIERTYREIVLTNKKVEDSSQTEITGAEKNKLFPTNTAMVVNDFLVGQFTNVVDYSFTADIEEELDEIARGKMDWDTMIRRFYDSFQHHVENSKNLKRSEVGSVRELGIDPKSGRKVYARLAKFGPVVQIGDADEEEKPRFSGLKNGQLIETITLQEAMELFKLPREVGVYEDVPVEANIGKYGPYVRHGNKFYSLGKEDDPYNIDIQRAIEVIEQKRHEDANRTIKTFDENPEFQILRGKWGPYLKAGRQNVRLPKDKKPEELSYEDCVALAEQAKSKPKTRTSRKSRS